MSRKLSVDALTRGRRARWFTAAVAAAAVAAAAEPAGAGAQVPAACPATFEVLHDDRIGALSLAQGSYTITVVDPAVLPCAAAADRFRQFLEDVDGVLPGGWRLDAPAAAFAGPDGQGFSVARAAGPSGGGGGAHPASGTRCPGTFSVVHDDRIGRLRLPAGGYSITLLAVGRLSCAAASARFAAFLQDFDGRLPGGWIVDAATGTFLRSAHVGFRVKPLGTPAGGGTSVAGRRCGGQLFSVDAAHRFPGLRLAPGAYQVWLLRGGASCDAAEQALGRLLDLRQGRLPRGWTLDPASATFSRRGTPQFRIKQARPLRES